MKAAKHILFLPDLLMYWLTGQMGTEYTIASTSQMLDMDAAMSAGAVCRNWWTRRCFRRFRCRAECGESVGERSEKLAGVPVVAVGSHDTASAVVGVPSRGDWLYLSSGTWSLELNVEVDEPVLTAKAAEYNVTNEGAWGKIRLLKNIGGDVFGAGVQAGVGGKR